MGLHRRALRPRRLVAAVLAAALSAFLSAGLGDGAATAARRPPTTSGSSGSTAATGSPTKPCGNKTFKKADGSPYRCSWSDEFSGSALDLSRWTVVRTAVNGQRTGDECLLDSADAVSVASNALSLTFVVIKILNDVSLVSLGITPATNLAWACWFTLSGVHTFHVLAGSLFTGWLGGPSFRMAADEPQRWSARIEATRRYWLFVDFIWLLIVISFYLT